MNKQQLASKIWKAANTMRSKIEANEYKDYILGFIFYKFLSEQEVIRYVQGNMGKISGIEELTEDDDDYASYFRSTIGYYIPYKHLFSTWLEKGNDFNVSDVRDAISCFYRNVSNDQKKVFDKIFDTLDKGLGNLGDNSTSQTKAVRGLINLIDDIPMDEKGYDVLGFIYEYLISMFAANAGKKAGEFYTPHEVSLLMSEIVAHHLKDKKNVSIYDPTSGSGSLLINIGKSLGRYIGDKNAIKYYAQELIESTYGLTRMNLVMRGISADHIIARNGDTLADDWPYFDDSDPDNTYEPLYVDAVVSNPPYSQNWDPKEMENDARFKEYGIAPKSKADYAFLLHDLYHLKPEGIMTIVLPHGVLFRGGEEEKIRSNLIEKNNIDAIIGLPANIFFGTGIPTLIMVLKKRKPDTDVLVIDASKGFEKVGKSNKLRSSDIKKIVDVYLSRSSVEGFSRLVSREEIRENGYNLNIPRYVDSSEKPESWDVYANAFGGIPNSEIEELSSYWKAFPSLRKELFEPIDGHTCGMKSDDIQSTIASNSDVIAYKNKLAEKLSDFPVYLKNELIDGLMTLNPNNEETVVADNLFARLEDIPLVDKYAAYQLLDDEWQVIATDLETIQGESIECLTAVDPNMVTKKKEGKEIEVQEGYRGRILPFELVQKELLSDSLAQIADLERKLEEESSIRETLLEEVSEDDKGSDVFDEEDGSFVSKEVANLAKTLKKRKIDDLDAFETIVLKANESFENEKGLKKKLKVAENKLEDDTRTAIENLTQEQSLGLLEKKWIDPIVKSIASLTDQVISALTSKLKALSKKYENSLSDLNGEIESSEKELSAMLDDLEADEFDKKGLEELKKLLKGNF